jgi:hypothetical protein
MSIERGSARSEHVRAEIGRQSYGAIGDIRTHLEQIPEAKSARAGSEVPIFSFTVGESDFFVIDEQREGEEVQTEQLYLEQNRGTTFVGAVDLFSRYRQTDPSGERAFFSGKAEVVIVKDGRIVSILQPGSFDRIAEILPPLGESQATREVKKDN